MNHFGQFATLLLCTISFKILFSKKIFYKEILKNRVEISTLSKNFQKLQWLPLESLRVLFYEAKLSFSERSIAI